MKSARLTKFDIEFYNGLMKGIASCHSILKKSQTKDEALEKLNHLMSRIQDKVTQMVEEALE